MKNPVCTALLILLSLNAFSREAPAVDVAIEKSINYITAQQFQQTDGTYTPGEWPVQMTAYFLPAILGVGKLFARPTEEPTAFGTSSIVNLLAETYIANPGLTKIPNLLRLATTSLPAYEIKDEFNYYQSRIYRGVKVRGPVASGYVPDFISGLTNIPSDADTTSATYMALAFVNSIDNAKTVSDFEVPKEALDTFSSFRDLDRTPHYYNWLDGIRHTGAFLTWFQDEKDPKMPKGIFQKPDAGTRIPFGKNDVDCVVNANAMRLLQSTNNTNQPGFADSCKLLNLVINKSKQRMCGIYYPNSYAVFFSISNVYKAGATCLEDSKNKAIQFLVSTQKDDGSWDNEPGIGRMDTTQSTALAMNALINYTQKGDPQYRHAIEAGLTYLLYQAEKNGEDQMYWKGEVFFAAIAQARNTVLWRSNSYTTALVNLALVKAKKYLEAAQ